MNASVSIELVVCLVGSDGCRESIATILPALPGDLPYCVIIADRAASSQALPFAARFGDDSTLVVREAADGTALGAGQALVMPRDARATVDGSAVRVSDRTPESGLDIDVLLTSVAESWKAAAVAVVLSGAGRDGAEGVRALHAAGATTIVERPDGAAAADMPEAAIATGVVDHVLDPSEVGAVVRGLLRRNSADEADAGAEDGARMLGAADDSGETGPESRRNLIGQIAVAVRDMTGVDFSGYKTTTLRRQVERRMTALRLTRLRAYRDVVATSREEADALASGLLVSVTSFFRDPDVWKALRAPVSELVDDAGGHLRAWVPGCATGPEAYSVAMTVAEVLGNPDDLPRRLKVFATDLDERALRTARAGRYPESQVEPVPPEMRDRWMQRDGAEWAVASSLRDCMVFARQNVALDPPFPRVHLVSLRNTLIYFEPPMQRQVLRLLHFSLVPGGLLLLGESERIVDTHELFETVNVRDRLYRRRPTPRNGAFPTLSPSGLPAEFLALPRPGPDDRDAVRDALIARFVPPSLVLDTDDEVVEVVGDVSAWCLVGERLHGRHALAVVRQGLRAAVRSAVVQARQVSSVVEQSAPLDGDEVMVSAYRLGDQRRGSGQRNGRLVVWFGTVGESAPAPQAGATRSRNGGRAAPAAGADPSAGELATTEAALQTTVDELGTSNEELQALNEELQASGEELQASNEEVRAANEELEATNEELEASNSELEASNSELQRRGDDLAAANADLENIQASLTSGLIIVDRDFRVLRYTALAVRVFALIENDIGRPLTAIPATMEIPDLQGKLRAAIDEQRDGMVEARGDRADWLLHVHPYRGVEGAVRGAIVTCTDITEVASAHRVAQGRLRDLVAVTEALREAVWQRADDGRILFLNSQVERLYGLARQRVVRDPSLLLAAVHPDDRERVGLAWAARHDRPFDIRYRIRRPDGGRRWIHESLVPVPPDGDWSGYTVSSALDVTEQHEGQEQTVEQIATLEAVFHNSVFGVLVLDPDERVVRANDVFSRMSGFDQQSLVGMPARILTHDSDPDVYHDTDETAPIARATLGIAHRRLLARDGTPYFVTVETRPLAGHGAAGQIVVVHDVTRLQEANEELTRRARFDPHTGLLSRTHFRARLGAELARAARSETMVAVLWIDLDGFKQVNDRFGHQTGDAALREIADRLRRLARREDAVGRLGGDEFAVLVTDIVQVDDVEPVAQQVLASLRDPVQLRHSRLHFSGAVGVAIGPGDGDDPDVLLHNADTAMYSAKERGKDRRVYFRPAMNAAAELRADLRQSLAEALRTRDFVMHYQPVIDIRTGAVRSMEALIRWVRGDTVATAGEFLPVAEQTGQIHTLGALALDLIDDDLRVLREDASISLPVCINLAPVQLEERDLVDRLLAWEPPGGLERIVVEITETTTLAAGGRAVEVLTLLARLGVRLSIDDFGTGYSNLGLLERLRPSIIKIDRTLLLGAADQPRGDAVLRAAVQLAHALEAEVVVEGVETEELWTLTRDLPAEQAQGYHLARPMPLADLVPWLGSRLGPSG